MGDLLPNIDSLIITESSKANPSLPAGIKGKIVAHHSQDIFMVQLDGRAGPIAVFSWEFRVLANNANDHVWKLVNTAS